MYVNRFTADPDDISTVIHDQIDTVTEARLPLGYLVPSAWTNVMRVPTNVTSRLITFTNPALSAAGFYRLVTPAQP